MTSLEEPSTQFQKHNSKKRVIEKASHCLCHLVSIGRKGDQLCTANCLTLKLYQNTTNPGGQRLRPHPGPWPSNQAPCSWSNEVGPRAWAQQKQLQGISECKGDAERLQPCGSGNRICLAGQGYEQKIHAVSDEIDLKKSMHHKATANKKQRHRQRTQTKKTKKKAKQWPHLRNPQHSSRNTIPRNVWSRKHHTAYVIWSQLDEKGISCALLRTALL